MHINIRNRVVVLSLVVGLVLSACTSSSGTSTTDGADGTTVPGDSGGTTATTEPDTGTTMSSDGGGHLVFASRETIDSAFAVETDDAFTLRAIGVADTLTQTSFEGDLVPSLATEWERTGDLTWEFTLREGVTFHNGTPVDAAAVTNALNHLLGVEAQARAFNTDTIASVEAVGDNVVRVTTVEPNTLVPLYLAAGNTIILAPSAYEGDQINPIEAGTGPFVMTGANLPQSVDLVRNDSYWGGPVALASAEVRFVPEGATRATLLQSGEAQLADNLPIPLLPILESDPNLTVVRADLARTPTLYINNQKPPFDDVRVRQAIQAAIDVELIATEVLEGAGSPAVGPFAPSAVFAPDNAQPVSRDVDRAQQLLAEAGVDPASLSLSIWTYASRPELPDVAVAIQGMLSDAGINADVRVADYAALEPDVLAGEFDTFLVSRSYLVDINDPIGYLQSDYSCDGTFNLEHYCDPALDERLDDVLSESDAALRYPVYAEIAREIQDKAINVFIYHQQEISVHSNEVQGYRIHPLQNYVLTADISISN